MSNTDPGLIGLFDAQPTSSPADPPDQDPDKPVPGQIEEPIEADLDEVVESFHGRMSGASPPAEAPSYSPPDPSGSSASLARPTVPIPSECTLSSDGSPFSDFDSAHYKAASMSSQTGESFIVQALGSSEFVVIPRNLFQPSPKTAYRNRDGQSDDSDAPDHLSMPLEDLKLSDFPDDHPVHRCGLARYKRYMKKGFRFKPAYRSMLPLLMLVPIGTLIYLFPITSLGLLPADVVANIVSAVPAEKLATGVSLFGALLAVFAFGRCLYDRHVRRYMLYPGFAKYEEGLIKRASTKIAYMNIVNYDVKQSVIGRLLNYGTLELSSAGSDGSEIEMHNILAPRLVEVVLEGKMDEARRALR